MRPLPLRFAMALVMAALLSGSFEVSAVPAAPGSPIPRQGRTGAAPDRETDAQAPGALRVTIETIAVDRRGTWTVGTDVADIFPGSAGVLEKSATLIGREQADPSREMVQLKTSVTPSLQAGGACVLGIEAETRRVVAGASSSGRRTAPDRTSTRVVLKEEESRLVEVYSSPVTQGRLALKLRCGAATPSDGAELRFVDFTLSIARADGDGTLAPIKSNRLRSALGREASAQASFNLPLPDGAEGGRRYRNEDIEVTLTPLLVSGGRLQLELKLRGELATVSAKEATTRHPIDRRETIVAPSGEPHSVDLEVLSSGAEEGWSKVRYRFDVVCEF
jgi:hypothetical protein